MKHAMHDWRGPDGKPDVHKMVEFVEQQDRSSLLDVIGWAPERAAVCNPNST